MNRLVWFAVLATVPIMAQEKQKAAPPPKTPMTKPLAAPAKPSPVENQDIDKRRDRMKQRDSEIDRVLKEQQRKAAEKSRDQKRR